MTEVLTTEGGAPHTVGTIDVCSRGALPTYIKEGEGGRQPRVRPSRRNPTWAPSPIRPPPLPYLDKGERKEGEGKEVGVLHNFLFLLSFPFLPTWLAL